MIEIFFKSSLTGFDRPRTLLIVINPMGGNQNASSIYKDTVEPLFTLAGIQCDTLGKLLCI